MSSVQESRNILIGSGAAQALAPEIVIPQGGPLCTYRLLTVRKSRILTFTEQDVIQRDIHKSIKCLIELWEFEDRELEPALGFAGCTLERRNALLETRLIGIVDESPVDDGRLIYPVEVLDLCSVQAFGLVIAEHGARTPALRSTERRVATFSFGISSKGLL